MKTSTSVGQQPEFVFGDSLLQVSDLQIYSAHGRHERSLVNRFDLTLKRGEAVAIVGESGSGKSLTARAICGLLPEGLQARGTVEYHARNLLSLGKRAAEYRGRDISLLLQDPFTMLNPLMRCGDQITELLGLPRGGARQRDAVRRLAEVGITDPRVADSYPFELSGGMRQRVALAASIARSPDILIADEPTTALDTTTQRDVLSMVRDVQIRRGMGLILITHDLRLAFAVCDRIYVLYAGSLIEVGRPVEMVELPRHPYTQGLLMSEPPIGRRLLSLTAIPGSVPRGEEVKHCCAFASRCGYAGDICRESAPALVYSESQTATACVRTDDIRSDMQRTVQHVGIDMTTRAGSAAPFVRVENLVVRYPRRTGGEVVAVGGVSLEISPGEIVGLVGESGSGKTTVARCLVGLAEPTSGGFRVDDEWFAGYRGASRTRRSRLHREIQMVFQDPYSSLNPSWTIGGVLRQALNVGGVRRPKREDVAALLQRVGLGAEYAERKPVALSGGERQRVAVARAVAVSPRLIVCDEPVSALDFSVQAQILNLLREVSRETNASLLFITHDLAVVRQITDRVYVMRDGHIVESGETEDVLSDPKEPYTRKLIAAIPNSGGDWLRPRGAVLVEGGGGEIVAPGDNGARPPVIS
jgi:peptide/nickel transport system ATP-binding protein